MTFSELNQSPLAPSFNLKAVVIETGLKPDTLRAWERRYGLPNPQRTGGGHRLYTQRDIDTLKWLIARQKDGLSISRAVDLWHKLENENKNPLQEMPVALPESPMQRIPSGSTLVDIRDKWIEACKEFDEQKAEHLISQAMAIYPPELVCFDIFQKGLAEIGMGWYEGNITAQQEHFASALTMRRLEAMVAACPPPTRNGRILIGCAPEEEHTFSALLLSLLLRRRGWEALYLGANLPLARLEATMAAADPKLVIIVAQTLHTASSLFAMAELLKRESVPLAFGGLVFSAIPSLQKRISGHFLGAQLEDAVINIEQFITSPRPIQTAHYASNAYTEALNHFLQRQAKLESIVWELMEDEDIRPNYLARANRDLSRSIIAALTLGDIRLIGDDKHWIEGLLMNYHYRMPKESIHAYVSAYQKAAEQALNGRGLILVDWLNRILENDKEYQEA